jgi:hypothetical protein
MTTTTPDFEGLLGGDVHAGKSISLFRKSTGGQTWFEELPETGERETPARRRGVEKASAP